MGSFIKWIFTIILSAFVLILVYDFIVLKFKPEIGCCSCCDKSERTCITSCCSCVKPIILTKYIDVEID